MHECRELEEVFATQVIDMIPQAEEGGNPQAQSPAEEQDYERGENLRLEKTEVVDMHSLEGGMGKAEGPCNR